MLSVLGTAPAVDAAPLQRSTVVDAISHSRTSRLAADLIVLTTKLTLLALPRTAPEKRNSLVYRTIFQAFCPGVRYRPASVLRDMATGCTVPLPAGIKPKALLEQVGCRLMRPPKNARELALHRRFIAYFIVAMGVNGASSPYERAAACQPPQSLLALLEPVTVDIIPPHKLSPPKLSVVPRIHLAATSLTLSGMWPKISAPGCRFRDRTFATKGTVDDLEPLTQQLLRLKRCFPGGREISISAAPQVPFRRISDLISAVRSVCTRRDKGKCVRTVSLYPNVKLSVRN